MPLEVCHVICRMPPASWQSLLGRSCLLVLLSSPFWIKWMRLTLKRVMSKQHSFYVTFVVLTFWWVRYPFVEIPAGPPRCWVCFPFYPFYLNSFCTKGWSQRLLLWGIHHSCSWKWSKRTPASMINPGCGWNLRLHSETCCNEQRSHMVFPVFPGAGAILAIYLQHRLHRRLMVLTGSQLYQLSGDTNVSTNGQMVPYCSLEMKWNGKSMFFSPHINLKFIFISPHTIFLNLLKIQQYV